MILVTPDDQNVEEAWEKEFIDRFSKKRLSDGASMFWSSVPINNVLALIRSEISKAEARGAEKLAAEIRKELIGYSNRMVDCFGDKLPFTFFEEHGNEEKRRTDIYRRGYKDAADVLIRLLPPHPDNHTE